MHVVTNDRFNTEGSIVVLLVIVTPETPHQPRKGGTHKPERHEYIYIPPYPQ